MNHISLSDERIEEIRKVTQEDEVFNKIVEYVEKGWPLNKKDVAKEIMPYFNSKNNIWVMDSIILKNNRIIIPHCLRKKILSNCLLPHEIVKIPWYKLDCD